MSWVLTNRIWVSDNKRELDRSKAEKWETQNILKITDDLVLLQFPWA